MPLLAELKGTKVRMWPFDHKPPHIHVKHAEHLARIEIMTGSLIDGYLPPRVRRRIVDWLDRCRKEILLRWQLASRGEGFGPIGEDCAEKGG
ncbi:MAG: DUF4160 domain-containing protein [Thermodesulfobacteriota bacterium]